MTVPPDITAAEVAAACEMRTERARRMLSRAGILERLGGRWVVTPSRLAERLPEVYERVCRHFDARTQRDAAPRTDTHGHA
jgi:hypothetical protein